VNVQPPISRSAMLSIRPATAADVPLLNTMIREFAEFERERELVSITEDDLLRDGFGATPKFRVLIAEWDGQTAGYALFFGFYSTWVGRAGIFLEDVFVRAQFRHRGIGKALFARVARIACDEGCNALRWEVMNWNQPAIDLYKAFGCTFLDERRSVLLTDEALKRLAESAK
jgi:GNAT superfamily N-acetyltransferase